MGKRASNVAAHDLTPRTNDAIAATRAAGFYLGQEYAVLTVLCRTLECENGLLRGALANAADAASRRRMPFGEEISADVVARGWLQTPNVEVQGQDEAQLRTVPLERPVGRKEE